MRGAREQGAPAILGSRAVARGRDERAWREGVARGRDERAWREDVVRGRGEGGRGERA